MPPHHKKICHGRRGEDRVLSQTAPPRCPIAPCPIALMPCIPMDTWCYEPLVAGHTGTQCVLWCMGSGMGERGCTPPYPVYWCAIVLLPYVPGTLCPLSRVPCYPVPHVSIGAECLGDRGIMPNGLFNAGMKLWNAGLVYVAKGVIRVWIG